MQPTLILSNCKNTVKSPKVYALNISEAGQIWVFARPFLAPEPFVWHPALKNLTPLKTKAERYNFL